MVRMTSRRRAVLGAWIALVSAPLLAISFRNGWTRVETDFPNYYTAAVLTRQGQALENFYNWTWFQRQMNYAGIERQLGGYTPNTPLTMLPAIPLASLSQQHAKQVWLAVGLILLGASIGILSRLSGLALVEVASLAALCWGALAENFLLGQYYLFLLFLLTCAAWCLLRGKPIAGGALIGVVFALKLYTAPFAIYFAVRRQWKALAAMLGAFAAMAAIAIAIFGFDGIWYFTTTLLPREIDGSVNDPYHPFWGSLTAFLRRTLVPEAELNPHPWIVFPGAFFFLRDVYALTMLALALMAAPRDERRAFAWFVIVLFALSPNTAAYHFLLLLVPAVLLLRGATTKWAVGWIALFALVELPLYQWDARLFPRAWLLIALFLYTGWEQLRALPRRRVAFALALIATFAAVDAWRRMRSWRVEPPQTAAHVVVDRNNIFASAPVIREGALVYEAIAQERYLLRSAGRDFAFDGEALHPALARAGPIYFELVAGGHSRICSYDFSTGRTETIVGTELDPTEPAVSMDGSRLAFVSRGSLFVREGGINSPRVRQNSSQPAFFPDGRRIVFAEGSPGRRTIRALSLEDDGMQTLVAGGDAFDPAVSPDGRLLAFTAAETGAHQVWILDLISGARRRLTEGVCNNESPAWDANSRAVVFTSDCRRGLGLPALYRVKVGEEGRR
jgi:Glycosyltransferase family 87/WD40-like Beta Propeller Repeat